MIKHKGGAVPVFRGAYEKKMAEWVLEIIREGKALSVHDISSGGLAIAAAEMALSSRKLGIKFKLDSNPVTLYSETPGYLMEVSAEFYDLATLPEFVSGVGTVCEEYSISGNDWKVDLGAVEDKWANRLESVIWREEEV